MLDVFELKLKDAIQKLPFQKILTLRNVQAVVNEADGYQPHIIAPENGYRWGGRAGRRAGGRVGGRVETAAGGVAGGPTLRGRGTEEWVGRARGVSCPGPDRSPAWRWLLHAGG